MATNVNSIDSLRRYYSAQEGASCLKIAATKYLNQILLIRHGEPDVKGTGWFNRSMALAYATSYDEVGIRRFESGPICLNSLRDIAIFHSPLPRARHTTQLIFGDRFNTIADTRFREFEKKMIPFFNIPLPLKFWTVLSRLVWYLGLNSAGIEDVKKAKLRAQENAVFLSEVANVKGIAVVVAHGLHNRYVSKYLKRSEWRPVRNGGIGHLSINILAKQRPESD